MLTIKKITKFKWDREKNVFESLKKVKSLCVIYIVHVTLGLAQAQSICQRPDGKEDKKKLITKIIKK